MKGEWIEGRREGGCFDGVLVGVVRKDVPVLDMHSYGGTTL